MVIYTQSEQNAIKILEGLGFKVEPGKWPFRSIDFQAWDRDGGISAVEAKSTRQLFSSRQIEAFKDSIVNHHNAYLIVNDAYDVSSYLLFKLVRMQDDGVVIGGNQKWP